MIQYRRIASIVLGKEFPFLLAGKKSSFLSFLVLKLLTRILQFARVHFNTAASPPFLQIRALITKHPWLLNKGLRCRVLPCAKPASWQKAPRHPALLTPPNSQAPLQVQAGKTRKTLCFASQCYQVCGPSTQIFTTVSAQCSHSLPCNLPCP